MEQEKFEEDNGDRKQLVKPKTVSKKKYDTLFFLFMMLVLVFMVWTVYYMVSNKVAFTTNPFIYGAEKMNGYTECSCTQDYDGKNFFFSFNDTDFWSKSTESFILEDWNE